MNCAAHFCCMTSKDLLYVAGGCRALKYVASVRLQANTYPSHPMHTTPGLWTRICFLAVVWQMRGAHADEHSQTSQRPIASLPAGLQAAPHLSMPFLNAFSSSSNVLASYDIATAEGSIFTRPGSTQSHLNSEIEVCCCCEYSEYDASSIAVGNMTQSM